jgi:hypothetical protein
VNIRHWPEQRRFRWMAAVVLLGIAGLISWAAIGDVPVLQDRHRPIVPRYLDAADSRVAAALAQSRTVNDLLGQIASTVEAEIPASSQLWTTPAEFNSDAAARLWQQHRAAQFISFPPYVVPENPDWSEDPYHNLSWQTLYQSLSWLQGPARLYVTTGDSQYQEEVRRYLLDWISNTPSHDAPSVRSWYDGSVAYRTDVIVRLFGPVLAGALEPSEVGVVLRSLEEHGQLLDGYLSQPGFRGHNHNLFHALSLYNLSIAFPELRNATRWRADARARISSLLPEMVDPSEGVSLEQAAGYHFLALGLFASADAYLRRHGDGLAADELVVLDRMTSFGAMLLTPTMQTPALGDTAYGSSGARQLLEDLKDRGISSPIAAFILSQGRAGARPPEAAFFPRAGYAIVRPTYSAGSAWARDLQLIVDTSSRLKPHGHNDAMSVILSAQGGPLLIDSGGPYRYGDPARQAFVGSLAHNMVVVGDGSAGQGPVEHLVEEDQATYAVVAGTVAIGGKALDRRVVLLLKPDTLVIVDLLHAVDGKVHPYQLLYHLPPGSSVIHDALGGVVTASPAAMGFQVATEGPGSLAIKEGQDDPLLGWVTHGVSGIKEPAPVLEFQQDAERAWFVTTIQPAAAGAASTPFLEVKELSGGALRLTLTADAQTTVVDVDPDGRIHLPS